MRVPGAKRLRSAGRWLRSRLETGGLILGYHRVTNNANDVYSTCVRPQHFAEQLAVLRQHANPIRLDDLIQGLQTGTLPPHAVAVTFDDGYADNYYQAMPLLTQYKIPITLFIATGYLGHRFWWDELVSLILDNPNLPSELLLEVTGKNHIWRISKDQDEDRHLLLGEVYQLLLSLTAEVRQQAMGQISQQINATKNQKNHGARALTPDELKEFCRSDLITIGAHTVTHPFLANLPEGAQRQEIDQCKQYLEALIGHPVTAFSFPNGSSNQTTRTLLCQSGFTSACASYNDAATVRCDLFNLPRFWIPDHDGDKFARWLRHWLPN